MLFRSPVIGRASYFIGVPLWKKTKMDELKGMYNTKTHDLMSGSEEEEEKEKVKEGKKR